MRSSKVNKKPSKPSSERLDIRISRSNKETITKAAKLSGVSNLSTYIKYIVLNNATRIIEDNEGILTTEKAREVFFKALDNPEPPNDTLKKAYQDYKKLRNR